jgi:hypothetical protein
MTNPAIETAPRTGSETVELTRDACLTMLASHQFGRLAVIGANNVPVIRPVNYRFEHSSQSVVFRTARGSKFHALVCASQAAFEIDEIDEATRTGWSVIVSGMVDEVTRPTDVDRLKRLGLEPWASGPKPHWMRVRAWTVSGRRIVLPRSILPRPGAPGSGARPAAAGGAAPL